MSEDEDQKGRGKNSWLSEHDSIQSELIKMKEELIKERVDRKETKIESPIESASQSQIEKEKEEPTVPSNDKKPDAPITTPPISGEMTIKQMLAKEQESVMEKKEEIIKRGEQKPPKRLEEGKIPVAPGLSSKIANVIQLENNLKRRKFEMEKKQREAKLPPPPKHPSKKEESKVTEREGIEKSDKGLIEDTGSAQKDENEPKGPQEQKTTMVRRVLKRFTRKTPTENGGPGKELENVAPSGKSHEIGSGDIEQNKELMDQSNSGKMRKEEVEEKNPATDPSIQDADFEKKPRKKDPLEKLRGLLGEK